MSLPYITSLFYLSLGMMITLLGIVIIKENIHQRINQITGIMMFFAGTGPIFTALGLFIQLSPNVQIDLTPFRKFFLIWEFFFPQMLLFSFYFPRELRWVKKYSKWLTLLYLPHLVHFLLVYLFASSTQIEQLIPLESFAKEFGLIVQPIVVIAKFFLTILSLIYTFHTNFFALINLVYIITAIVLMMMSYKKLTNERLKKQVSIVLWGIRASVGLYAIAFLFPRLNIFQFNLSISYLLTTVALLIGASSIAWAIIRYQFMDIRLIIRRGLVFSLTSTILVVFYLLFYNQGKRIVRELLGINLPILEVVFIFFALIFFQPILSALETLLDKVFSKDKLDYRNILQKFSHEIMTILKKDALVEKIETLMKDVLSLEETHIFLSNDSHTLYSLHEDDAIQIKPSKEFCQLMIEVEGPMRFDQLAIRCHDDHALELLRGFHAYLIVPFIYRDRVLGFLVLSEKITKTSFTTEDIMMLSVTANQVAIALENARLYDEALVMQRMEEELKLAKNIQEHLLPSYIPKSDVFELSGLNIPSKDVGGDYYDFIQLDPDKIGIAIGDIAGKGIPAAILMSNLQAALRICAGRNTCTHEVMHEVNNQITRTTDSEKFATFFYGVLNHEKLSFEYTNAGHNYPILWRQGMKPLFLKEGGFIVGVMEDAPYASAQINLMPGDVVVFYTDGITEALNPFEEEYGEDRLLQLIGEVAHLSSQEIIDAILESVCDFSANDVQFDDLTLVVLKTKLCQN